MASSVQFADIKLTENDVPGACFQNKPVEAHSVVQLKRWLTCRGRKIGGKKTELVERVKLCISTGNTEIVANVDNNTHYNKKMRTARKKIMKSEEISDTVPPFPINGWKKFCSAEIPNNFSYGSIYNHLIETAVLTGNGDDQSDGELEPEFNTSKPLQKGRQFFKSGHVKNMEDCKTKKEQHYCLKSNVLSSYRDNVSFKVMIMLDFKSGLVLDSACECIASAMGRCNHVAALLFALEDYIITFGYGPVACTSKVCEWNVGRSQKNPSMIMEKLYSDKIDKSLIHEYFPEKNASYDKNKLTDTLLYEVQALGEPSMWGLLLEYHYDDYTLSDEISSNLALNIIEFRQSLLFGFNKSSEVPGTNGQTDDTKWFRLRQLLITASICKDIYDLQSTTYFSKIRSTLWFPEYFENKYTKYGKQHEPDARHQYERETGCSVITSGLWINPKYIGLGATPDGIIFDPKVKSSGVLEIKCPYVLKDLLPTEICKLTSTQKSAFCCSLNESGQLKIKTNHKYYFQVQQQMAILEKKWCDFVIWTFKGIHIERVNFDELFWNNVFPTLGKFHENVISCEYFEMRIPRNLQPFVFGE